jgi:GntR family transcriptional regulator
MTEAKVPDEWRVDRGLSTPLYRQLALNIRWSISTGRILRGELLPPVREVAARLGLSINTILNAYKDLEDQELVVARPRHGTEVIGMVKAGGRQVDEGEAGESLFQAVLQSTALGHEPGRIREMFEKALERVSALRSKKPIVFVECTGFDAQNLADQLSRDLEIPVVPVVLDQLQSWLGGEKDVSRTYRAVVTTFFHYTAVMQAVGPYGIPIFGVVVENNPDTLKVIAEVLTAGKIGVVCRREDSTQYFVNKVRAMSADSCEIRLVFVNQTQELKELLHWGDAFFITQPCKQRVEELRPGARIFFFYDRVNEQSIAMLKQYLEKDGNERDQAAV